MYLDPTLRGADRIGNLVAGAALVAYSFWGDFEHVWVRAVLVILGSVLAVGSVAGT